MPQRRSDNSAARLDHGSRAAKVDVLGSDPPEMTPLRILLSLLLLLQGVAAFLPGPLLWGMNHLAYAPWPVRILWPLAGLAVIWLPLGPALGRWLALRAAPLLLGRRALAYAVLPLLGVLGFYFLRCRTHFLGDGWLLGELVSKNVPYHGFDLMDYVLHERIFRALELRTEEGSFRVFAAISIIAGGFYLQAAAWSARRMAADWGGRILLYALLIFFAPVQMFMGYVECYSILAVAMLLLVTSTALYYRRRAALWMPAVAFAVGLGFHLDALFLAPLLALAVFWPPRWERAPLPVRLVTAVGPTLIAIGIVLILHLLEGYTRAQFEVDFFDLRQGQRLLTPFLGSHGVLSAHHWKDLVNLWLLLAPVPAAMLIAAWEQRRSAGTWPQAVVVCLAGCLWLMLIMALLHMKLGIARDWDLLAAPSSLFVVAAFLAWVHISEKRVGPRTIGWVVITAAVLTLPWFWLNAGAERSVARFSDIIADQPRFSRAYAHEEIGKYYRKNDRLEEALAEYRLTTQIFPENPRFHAVLGLVQHNMGDIPGAIETFRNSLVVDSTFALGLQMMARIMAKQDNPDQTLHYARRLAGRREETARAAALHGAAAEHFGYHEEALAAYTRAVRKDPTRVDQIGRIGSLALMLGRVPQAEVAFRELLRQRPKSFPGRVGLAATLWQPIQHAPELWHEAAIRKRMLEALGLLAGLISEGQDTEEIRRWHEELRVALSG